ncbi:MAG: hypothetical protein KKB50_00465 [Planctomycetes bacterium]|nr:hypothetical protein [Planctomycetota bacterium]
MSDDIPLSADERKVLRVIYRWECAPYPGADSPPETPKRDQLRPVSPVPGYLIEAVLYGANVASTLALLSLTKHELVRLSERSIDIEGKWRLDDDRVLKTHVAGLWHGDPDGQYKGIRWELSHPDGRAIAKVICPLPASVEPQKRMTPCYTLTKAGLGAAKQVVRRAIGDSASGDEPNHAPGFSSVNWSGEHYVFSKGNQREAVKLLWEAWEGGGHSLSQEIIGDRIGSTASRFELAKVFRRKVAGGGYEPHPAWGTMIQQDSKGSYRLAPPESA